jgi:hypothetical protein
MASGFLLVKLPQGTIERISLGKPSEYTIRMANSTFAILKGFQSICEGVVVAAIGEEASGMDFLLVYDS